MGHVSVLAVLAALAVVRGVGCCRINDKQVDCRRDTEVKKCCRIKVGNLSNDKVAKKFLAMQVGRRTANAARVANEGFVVGCNSGFPGSSNFFCSFCSTLGFLCFLCFLCFLGFCKNRFDLFCTATIFKFKLPKVCRDKYWIDLDRQQRQYSEHFGCVGIAESEKV